MKGDGDIRCTTIQVGSKKKEQKEKILMGKKNEISSGTLTAIVGNTNAGGFRGPVEGGAGGAATATGAGVPSWFISPENQRELMKWKGWRK